MFEGYHPEMEAVHLSNSQRLEEIIGELSPYPIQEPNKVDQLRAKLGLSPLEQQTKLIRERAEREGRKRPKDYSARLKRSRDWAKKVGWIEAEEVKRCR